ncbi:MAG TPA: hypothetical protein VNB22_19605 [Pyrinomonadaceae bacterium]|nr:hypothetical protein [Pyrinomonadaceae bacterium]
MAKKKLTIKGITFPDFGDDDSKKNFRLIFYIAYTDKNGDETATIVSKPDSGQWQWRKSSKDFFLPPTIVGDSAELNTSFLKTGGNGFAPASDKIAEIDGEITDITVQFLDVFDASIGDFLKRNILPEVIKQLQGLGINPIDLIPVPGVFTTVIKDKIKIDELATRVENFLTKEKKDKLLHTISAEYDGKKTFTLKEEKEWNPKKHKKGTYGVTIGVK